MELVLRHVWVRQRPVVSLIALWVRTFLVVLQSADDKRDRTCGEKQQREREREGLGERRVRDGYAPEKGASVQEKEIVVGRPVPCSFFSLA